MLHFPENDPLMRACASALGDLGAAGAAAAASLHPAVLSRELVLNGSMRQFYRRCQSLFLTVPLKLPPSKP